METKVNITEEVLLDIKDLTVEYVSSRNLLSRSGRRVRILEDFNLQIYRGETLGVVGESGCGKTTLANSVARFIQPTAGQVLFEGQDLLAMDRATFRRRRRELQMVFQNPFNSLDPSMEVLNLVGEPLVTHTKIRGDELKSRVEELLVEVGLDAEHMKSHPHKLSGGQAQRVALARALALNPKLLLLDEPTSSLDVSVQAQIINLLQELQEKFNLTSMYISHDLGVVQHICDRIAVIYLGEVVELASRDEITRSPQHPYTQLLFSSTPVPDPESGKERFILEENIPSLSNPPAGCRFHSRCPRVMEICRVEKPAAHSVEGGHWATCHLLNK
jgi:oligopeptide/dipeptide ABC transporter ATP-binding protein